MCVIVPYYYKCVCSFSSSFFFDLQITTELYEADLEKALILSKLEYEQHKQVHGPPHTYMLEDCQTGCLPILKSL